MSNPLILLVEDDPNDEELTVRALSALKVPIRIFVVRDGAEALDYLCNRDAYTDPAQFPSPDIVLLDLRLPRLNGLEVLREMRGWSPTSLIPVVMLSSSTEGENLRHAYELGANSFVEKPASFRDFTNTVRHLGEYWLSFNRQPTLKPAIIA